VNAYYFSLCAYQRILRYKNYVYLRIHLRIPSLMDSVLDYFHIRLKSDLFLLLDPYLTRFYVSLQTQDICSTC